ncbi:MAG TPA: LTA synthase family protein, partial [Cytophagaceae bacterium]
AYIHGGDLEFANMKSYIYNSGYDEVIGKFEFDKKFWNSKWGAHDEIVLEKTLEKANQLKQPFFTTTFTLSSHEPFEIPIPPVFKGDDKETKFLNSLYYTDKCIGDFIREAKKQNWWNNTLIIIVADHGHTLPGSIYPTREPSEFKIPMLWLGGALTVKDTVEQIGSQCDIATTLLTQLNIPATNFKFGKDLLNPQSMPFAYYSYNDGFGMVFKDKYYLFDNKSQKRIESKGEISPLEEAIGKSYLQVSFEDFLNK